MQNVTLLSDEILIIEINQIAQKTKLTGITTLNFWKTNILGKCDNIKKKLISLLNFSEFYWVSRNY